MDDLQPRRSHTHTHTHTDLLPFLPFGSVHRAEYSGDRYTKTDSRYYEDLILVEMVMESTVVKDVPETTVFGEYQTNRISKALVSLHMELLRRIFSARRFASHCNKGLPEFLKQTEV